jgi:hypothetical protein
MIVSFISLISLSGTLLTNLQPATSARFTGCIGAISFPSGVDFVFAQIGVVQEACPVVSA